MKRSERGSITVWLVGIFPVLLLLFVFFINVMTLVDTKIRAQGAVDRGIYAGASYLAFVMNHVSELNADFRDEYIKKKESFAKMSEDSADWIEKQIKELSKNQEVLREEMQQYLKEGYEKAHTIAEALIQKNLKYEKNLSGIEYAPLYGMPGEDMFFPVDEWSKNEERWLNKEMLHPIEITGLSYDPENYSEYSYEVDTYLMKDPNEHVALLGRMSATFRSPLMSKFFDHSEGLRLHVLAAAQPAGNSIKEYALSREGEYHPYFIPISHFIGGGDE